MEQTIKKPEIKDLIQNLKTNNDAILIIGDKCAKDSFKINESTKDSFNRKAMVKTPAEFWKWYDQNIFNNSEISEEEKAINKLLKKANIKLAINLNNTGHIHHNNIIELRENKNILRCMSCDTIYEYLSVSTEEITNKVMKCKCGGKIAPTVTMFGEKYRQNDVNAIKDVIFIEDGEKIKLNTHTLIFVGVDFEEDYMHELIESFNAIKMNMQEDEKYYTVMICEKDGISIDLYQPEFATYENIADSINRLIKHLEE